MENARDYIISRFKEHDLLLLGERHGVKDVLDFIGDMIPELYMNGVTNLVMEFGCYENQEILDKLITGRKYDPNKARDMMFDYNVRWAYVEYMDLYRKAFEFNQKVKSKKKFRIVNMSYRYHFEEYKGIFNYDTILKIFDKGCIAKYRADVISKEILEKGEKGLVLAGLSHIFTKYKQRIYSQNEDSLFTPLDKGLGHRLYDKYRNRITNAFFYLDFPNRETFFQDYLPADGKIDELLKDKTYVGIDLENGEFGELKDNSLYSFGYDAFKLKNLADGLIYLKPLSEIEDATIDFHFLDGKDFREVYERFPDPNVDRKPENIKEYFALVKPYNPRKKK